ncbi:MAG: hypothetical protein QNJ62_08105 [Methyloceanibacter sp.]|nr:hypothetical protein [Methyloceanibacter sp.]
MTLGERVFIYCERGTNEALWAEPINAISNAGFFVAALIFWQLVLWRPPEQRSADHYLFIALVFAICFGSTAFHVYADQGTALADVIPIGLFMLVYFGFALNRFLNVPPGWTVFLVAIFAGLIGAATQIQCWEGGVGFAGMAPDDAKSCMNGSVGYLPALGVLIVVSMLVAERRHKAAPYLLAATLVFAGSILLRSLDMALCESVVVEDRHTGTHFIWHLLNAVVLFLLMRASLETETKPEPEPVEEKLEEKTPAAAAQPEAADELKEEPEAKGESGAQKERGTTKASEDEQAPDEKGTSSDAAEKDLAKDEGDPKDENKPSGDKEPSEDNVPEDRPPDEESPKDQSSEVDSSEDDSAAKKKPS